MPGIYTAAVATSEDTEVERGIAAADRETYDGNCIPLEQVCVVR